MTKISENLQVLLRTLLIFVSAQATFHGGHDAQRAHL